MDRRTSIGMALALLLVGASSCNQAPGPAPTGTATTEDGVQHVAIRVTDKGFEPKEVRLKQGSRGVLDFTRETDSECLESVLMPWAKEPVKLPKGQKVAVEIPDMSKAGEFNYSCWMNMVFGHVVIDPR
jgi:plastocyanin domain-containing protein